MKPLTTVLAAILMGTGGPAAQDEKPKDDSRLAAIGGLGASALYLAYLTIGTTADGFSKGVYDADQVKSTVESVSNLMKTNSDQLAAVRKGGLTEEDGRFVDEMIAIMGMLRDYGKHLVDYTKEKDPKVGDAFDEQRKKTWERIKKLLGIK
jgi:hypothetical protein